MWGVLVCHSYKFSAGCGTVTSLGEGKVSKGCLHPPQHWQVELASFIWPWILTLTEEMENGEKGNKLPDGEF